MDCDLVIEMFLRGEIGLLSAENRSERRTVDGVTILHTDDMWNGQRRESDEVIVRTQHPAAVLHTLTVYQPAPSHLISLIDRPATDHAAYEAAGYCHASTETLMVRSLTNLPPRDSRYTVEYATTPAHMTWLNAHDPANRAWITETQLTEPRLRHSFIALDQRAVVRVRVCQVDAQYGYVSHLYTAPEYRRRGLAQALMTELLHTAAAQGEHWSVLVASDAGKVLYEALGYQPCANLCVFEPKA